jgi:hypothetical protein
MRLIGLAVVAVGALAVAGMLLRADDAKPVAPRDVNFEGKVLVVTLKSARTEPLQLEKVATRHIGDQWFLVGSWVTDGRRASGRGLIWVPVPEVAAMEELDRDQYRKVYAPKEP